MCADAQLQGSAPLHRCKNLQHCGTSHATSADRSHRPSDCKSLHRRPSGPAEPRRSSCTVAYAAQRARRPRFPAGRARPREIGDLSARLPVTGTVTVARARPGWVTSPGRANRGKGRPAARRRPEEANLPLRESGGQVPVGSSSPRRPRARPGLRLSGQDTGVYHTLRISVSISHIGGGCQLASYWQY